MTTKKRVLGTIFCIVMALTITIGVPLDAKATAIPVLSKDIFGDGSVMIDVAAEFVGGTAWDFTYQVSNPNRSIAFMTFGMVNTTNFKVYDFQVLEYDDYPTSNQPPVTPNSFFPMFDPYLPEGTNYSFTIRFGNGDIFTGGQSIGIRASDGTYRSMIAKYEDPPDPVSAIPEPASIWILSTGIIMIGLWSSRRRRRSR